MKALLRSIEPLFVRNWRQARSLGVDSEKLSAFSDQETMARVANTRFYRPDEHAKIPGWMTPKERQMLYALARHLPGPITEIGSWVGLSTTAIACGIRDSKQAKQFLTYDLKLTESQFRPVDGGIGLFIGDDLIPSGI